MKVIHKKLPRHVAAAGEFFVSGKPSSLGLRGRHGVVFGAVALAELVHTTRRIEHYVLAQIAQELGLAESTGQNHKSQISRLVGLAGVYQLKIFAGSVAHLLP